MTVRRDLDKLEADGVLRRTHGGAVAQHRTQIELNYLARQKQHRREKESIGELAAGLVEDGQSVFLDAGTTVLAMVQHLTDRKALTVITTSLPVQMALLNSPSVDVILVGGQVLAPTMSLIGTLAQETISNMRFDWTFLGTGGIDVDRGLTHSTMEEIPIKKAAAASGSKVAVLVDHHKFGYNALSLFMPMDDIDMIVTDRLAETGEAEALRTDRHIKVMWPQSDRSEVSQ